MIRVIISVHTVNYHPLIHPGEGVYCNSRLVVSSRQDSESAPTVVNDIGVEISHDPALQTIV